MLKITYKYYCDFCKQEIRQEENYDWMCRLPLFDPHNHSLPRPKYSSGVGQYDACTSCEQIALSAITEKVLGI